MPTRVKEAQPAWTGLETPGLAMVECPGVFGRGRWGARAALRPRDRPGASARRAKGANMIRIGQARLPIRERAADLKGEVCATAAWECASLRALWRKRRQAAAVQGGFRRRGRVSMQRRLVVQVCGFLMGKHEGSAELENNSALPANFALGAQTSGKVCASRATAARPSCHGLACLMKPVDFLK
jgi:hypothetical protein